jgi:hypothetical protein
MEDLIKAVKKERTLERNRLSREFSTLKRRGFMFAYSGAKSCNPVLFLEGDKCLVAVAGDLFSLCTTSTHFGPQLPYRIPWKSSEGNKPNAALTSTQLRIDTEGNLEPYTLIYYRYISMEMLKSVAEFKRIPIGSIDIDHINNKRGDNRIDNLRPADPDQNNKNRNPDGAVPAFFTWDEVEANLAAGIWSVRTMDKKALKALVAGAAA